MSLDLYQPCPGGLDKKIKFCCKELAHQLDSINRKLDGDQLHAALDEVNRVLEQYPDRPCLLSFKIQALMRLEDASVKETVARFLQVAPENPIALASAAIGACLAEPDVAPTSEHPTEAEDLDSGECSPECRKAVDYLQSALEAAGDSIPFQVYHAVAVVAQRLMIESMFIAAREHLVFQIMLDRELAEEPMVQLASLSRSTSLNILLRQDMTLSPCPDDVAWSDEYAAALASASRGLWRRATELLELLSQKVGHPLILKALTVLYCRLAEHDKAVAALRKLARSVDADHDDAVEAEALAQLLDTSTKRTEVDVIQVNIPIRDADEVLTKLQSDSHFMASAKGDDPEADGPPPKAVFAVLDRPSAGSIELDVTEIPRQLTVLELYGRETDKPARITYIVARNELADTARRIVTDVLGDFAQGDWQEEVVSTTPRDGLWTLPVVRVPQNIDRKKRTQLQVEVQEKVYLEKWINTPRDVLGGKTPLEAASVPELQIPLEATVLLMELSSISHLQQVFRRLRERVNLPQAQTIKPDVALMRHLPVSRFHRLEVSLLSDQDLLMSFSLANQSVFLPSIQKLGREILNRESLHDRVNRDDVMVALAGTLEDVDESLELIQEAQRVAIKQGRSPARWKIQEFRMRLLRGEAAAAQQLLHEIQSKYAREPGVGELLIAELSRFGLLPSRPGASRGAVPSSSAEAMDENFPSALVSSPPLTGGETASPATESTPQPPSKLWLPGMD